MTPLQALLSRLPGLYDDLELAMARQSAHPLARAQEGNTGSGGGDPTAKPVPVELDVVEHRHQLRRGLRWWVDAVAPNPEDRPTIVGGNVAAMCRLLSRHLPAMALEDQGELHANLSAWEAKAAGLLGPLEGDSRVDLPAGAADQEVRVADAARLLGCTVRTIQRRVPAELRQGGVVVLGEAMGGRCDRCDLWLAAGCACVVKR